MLRGKTEETPLAGHAAATTPADETKLPGLENPYTTGERSPGVLFYLPKHSFWHPYHLLQRMEFKTEELRLVFASEDVVIRGRSLHPLYVELARQTVSRLVEQGARYAALSAEGTLVTQIERQPHLEDKQQQP